MFYNWRKLIQRFKKRIKADAYMCIVCLFLKRKYIQIALGTLYVLKDL